MLRTALRCVGVRGFAEEKLRPELVQKLLDMGADYADARAFRNLSFRELKEKVPDDLWAKMTANDPLKKYPELSKFQEIDDIMPQNNPRLPPHLTRPAVILNERQLAAQRMTLEFAKREGRMKKQQDAEIDAFQSLTSDGYEVNIGLVVAREPIWMTINPVDLEFAKVRHKTWETHNMYFVADKSLTEYEVPPDDSVHEEVARKRTLAKKALAEGTAYEFTPGSIHYLDANPKETDPHSVANAGGNRVVLLFKDKVTQKWVFPSKPAYGRRSLDTVKEEIRKELLLDQVRLHHLGPSPLFHTMQKAAFSKTVTRPLSFDETVYNMYFRRLKILFPNAREPDLEEFLEVRHNMKKETEAVERQIQGSKTFFFQSVLLKGSVQKLPPQYEDWAWVPQAHLSRYLGKEEFEVVAPVIARY